MIEEPKRIDYAIVETNPNAWRGTGRFVRIPVSEETYKKGDHLLVIVRGAKRVTSLLVQLHNKNQGLWVSEVLEGSEVA